MAVDRCSGHGVFFTCPSTEVNLPTSFAAKGSERVAGVVNRFVGAGGALNDMHLADIMLRFVRRRSHGGQ